MDGSTFYLDGGKAKRGIFIIIREGMERLTGMTEKQANNGLWIVSNEKNWIVDFEKRVD
ncbi:hypothetical protein [Candidatus Enterococcus ikei]|uniref:Uncharacterized protein n=1 Tax=Candidatus Enterococcus ikei TaxID=2815326 RepID=A0ABS3GVV6_9ENTE|nr:hypothetical protein [Enterococcus sp. DIV0869a]MBO0439398.1 hypothetical protein [Enterococcus sp. DIV0869a]